MLIVDLQCYKLLVGAQARHFHIKGTGMLVRNFELDSQTRPIGAWLELYLARPKRY